tara:strand:- start:20 stop:214 length:195 start_codon:yes stop_codon:yes gene_type:complete
MNIGDLVRYRGTTVYNRPNLIGVVTKSFPHQREGKRNVKVYFVDGSERLIPQFWLIVLHPVTDP